MRRTRTTPGRAAVALRYAAEHAHTARLCAAAYPDATRDAILDAIAAINRAAALVQLDVRSVAVTVSHRSRVTERARRERVAASVGDAVKRMERAVLCALANREKRNNRAQSPTSCGDTYQSATQGML